MAGIHGSDQIQEDQESPRMHTFIPKVLESRQFSYTHPETRRVRSPTYPKREKKEIAAELAFTFSQQGPVLVFCTQPQWVESVCKTIINQSIGLREAVGEQLPAHFSYSEPSRSLLLAKSWLGEDHVVTKSLARGIALHHGRLPHALREAIETDCRGGKYQVVVATNTLAQGVNLPVRTVIIHSTRRGDSNSNPSRIPVRDYWNIVGRAGRAGHETEGLVLHITLNERDRRDYFHFTDGANLEPVEGELFRRLRRLISSRMPQVDLEETAAVLDPEVLAIAVEEGITDPGSSDWADASANTLAAEIARRANLDTRPIVACFRHAAIRAFNRIPGPNWRSVYAKTGLSSSSCHSIYESVQSRQREVDTILRRVDVGNLSNLNRLAVEVCLPLTEMQSNIQFSGDQEYLLELWINGDPIQEIWSQTVGVDDSLETFTRYIDDFLGFRLPWVVSGMIRIAQEICELPDQDMSEYVRHYASMIKFGVPDPTSAWAMASGIATREIAIQIARSYMSNSTDSSSYDQFISWFSDLSDDMLRIEFGISGYALEDLRFKFRKLAANPHLKPIRNLDELLPIETEIVGMQFGNRWVAARRLAEGDELELRRDYENPVDPNAIAVLREGAIMGYLENALAQRLAPELDALQAITARVSSVSRERIGLDEVVTAELFR